MRVASFSALARRARDEDEAAPCRVRGRDPVAPVGARLADVERQDEADARALVHAGVQDFGETPGRLGERGPVERGDGD